MSSPEEDFNKTVQWLLNELQKELIVVDNDIVQFFFVEEKGAPSEREQKRVIKWLCSLNAVENLERITTDHILPHLSLFAPRPTIGYKLKVIKPIFVALRKIYESDLDRKPASEIIEQARKLGVSKPVDITEPKQSLDKIPRFLKESREIIYLDRTCEIPPGNQFELAKELFQVPVGTWVKENDVVENFNRGEGKQSFYDAQRLLNVRIKEKLGVENFIEYQAAMARINPATIEKLNQSGK